MKKGNSQKLKTYRAFSILMILSGVVLMVYMIRVEDEPGFIPMLLVIIGIVWLFYNQIKIKKQNN